MLNQAENFRVKILNTIFATISLGLIFLGLVSCGITQPSPPFIERPTIDPDPSPTQTDLDEDEEDEENDQDDADQDDKSDTDKDKKN